MTTRRPLYPRCGYDVSATLDAGRVVCPECSAGVRREDCIDGASLEGLRSRAARRLGVCALVGLVATSEFCAGPRRRIEALGFLATLGGCIAGVVVGIVVPALVP